MSTETVKVLDLSAWQQRVDYDLIKDQGVKGVILRASSGHYYGDIAFRLHQWEFNKRCIEVGAYHFFDARRDPVWQADCFHAIQDGCSIPPSGDLETLYGLAPKTVASNFTIFMAHLRDLSYLRPMLYTRGIFFNRYILPYIDWAGKCPLWVAHYTTRPNPIMPKGWARYDLWQYTDHGRMDGIKSNVDFNRAHTSGVLARFAA